MIKKNLVLYSGIIVMFVILILTNPSETIHKEEVRKILYSSMNKELFNPDDDSITPTFRGIGMLIGEKYIESMVDGLISRKNFLLFSLTTIEFEGKSKTLGIGVLGNVFLTTKLQDHLKDNPNLDRKEGIQDPVSLEEPIEQLYPSKEPAANNVEIPTNDFGTELLKDLDNPNYLEVAKKWNKLYDRLPEKSKGLAGDYGDLYGLNKGNYWGLCGEHANNDIGFFITENFGATGGKTVDEEKIGYRAGMVYFFIKYQLLGCQD